MANHLISYPQGASAVSRGQACAFSSGAVPATDADAVPLGVCFSADDDRAELYGAGAQVVEALAGGSIDPGDYVVPTTGGAFLAIADVSAHVGWVWGMATSAGASGRRFGLNYSPFYVSAAPE